MKRISLLILVFALVLQLLTGCVFAGAYQENESVFAGPLFALIAMYAFFGILTIAVRCFSEWLMARFFHLDRDDGKVVILTNLIPLSVVCILGVSPVFFPLIVSLSMSLPTYLLLLAVIEIPFLLIKYWVYQKKMFVLTKMECLSFTLAAGIVSLLMSFLVSALYSVILLF